MKISESANTPAMNDDELTRVFNEIDDDGNGYITPREAKKAFKKLAEKFNINDLKVGIEWVLENADYDILCQKGLEKVLKEFDSAVVAAKYIDLYKEMLNNLAIKNLD